jgi:hypothetical protein
MSTAAESREKRKLELPKLKRTLRRFLELNRELSPAEIDALCELRLAVRGQLLNQPLEKR